jgi:hypothetical protein
VKLGRPRGRSAESAHAGACIDGPRARNGQDRHEALDFLEAVSHARPRAVSREGACGRGGAILVRAHEKTRELQALFKAGLRSLIIGIVILAICLAVGWLASLMRGDGPLPE